MALVFGGSFNLICNQFLGASPFLFGNLYFLVVKIKDTCSSYIHFSLFPPVYIFCVRRRERVVLHQEAEKIPNLKREYPVRRILVKKKIKKRKKL